MSDTERHLINIPDRLWDNGKNLRLIEWWMAELAEKGKLEICFSLEEKKPEPCLPLMGHPNGQEQCPAHSDDTLSKHPLPLNHKGDVDIGNLMVAEYGGTCGHCGKRYEAGSQIYSRTNRAGKKTRFHKHCDHWPDYR